MPEKLKFAAKGRVRQKRVKSPAPPLADKAPKSQRITAYDEAHFAIYLRLLDATSKAVSEEAMIDIILESSPRMSRDKARRALLSHLKRAIWMSGEGYRHLLGKKRQPSP
jgi:hypothetical protein